MVMEEELEWEAFEDKNRRAEIEDMFCIFSV